MMALFQTIVAIALCIPLGAAAFAAWRCVQHEVTTSVSARRHGFAVERRHVVSGEHWERDAYLALYDETG